MLRQQESTALFDKVFIRQQAEIILKAEARIRPAIDREAIRKEKKADKQRQADIESQEPLIFDNRASVLIQLLERFEVTTDKPYRIFRHDGAKSAHPYTDLIIQIDAGIQAYNRSWGDLQGTNPMESAFLEIRENILKYIKRKKLDDVQESFKPTGDQKEEHQSHQIDAKYVNSTPALMMALRKADKRFNVSKNCSPVTRTVKKYARDTCVGATCAGLIGGGLSLIVTGFVILGTWRNVYGRHYGIDISNPDNPVAQSYGCYLAQSKDYIIKPFSEFNAKAYNENPDPERYVYFNCPNGTNMSNFNYDMHTHSKKFAQHKADAWRDSNGESGGRTWAKLAAIYGISISAGLGACIGFFCRYKTPDAEQPNDSLEQREEYYMALPGAGPYEKHAASNAPGGPGAKLQ